MCTWPSAGGLVDPDPATVPVAANLLDPTARAGRRHGSAGRLRQTLVVALAVVSGATDTIGLLALGGAVPRPMTRNLGLLRGAAGSALGARAAAGGLALL